MASIDGGFVASVRCAAWTFTANHSAVNAKFVVMSEYCVFETWRFQLAR